MYSRLFYITLIFIKDMNESIIVAILKLLIEQDQSYKFIIGLVTFFIIPQFINIVNASIAKRAAAKKPAVNSEAS